MRDILREIIELQSEYSATNTPAMYRRGKLIRDDMRLGLENLAQQLAGAINIDTASDLIIEGRDGTGQKSKVPWTRFGSKDRAPTANSGWYCVFLFRPQADAVYLCLSHASTKWNGGDYVSRPEEQIQPLMHWGRELLKEEAQTYELTTQIDLNKANRLAIAYEKSTLLAKLYTLNDLPSDEHLEEDLIVFSKMLGKIYELEDKGQGPNETHYQMEVTQKQFRNYELGEIKSAKAQGYGLSAPERKAVELRAMDVAKDWLEAEGYSVSDVSSNHSCDYHAIKNRKKFYVEVKGTTGRGEAIIITKNELALHRANFPNNILILVSGIKLNRQASTPLATGGQMSAVSPWAIEDANLSPLAFQYVL